jgi:acetyl-CoA C-acetyltransferase
VSPDPFRVPVIVGVGQVVERDEVVSCIDLMERASKAAFDEAPALAAKIGSVTTVDVIGDGRKRPASELADRMSLPPGRRATSTMGGNTPQWLVTRAAADIAEGRADTVLLAGAEAGRSDRLRQASDAIGDDPPDQVVGVEGAGWSPAEAAVRLLLPVHVYPLFESALAAAAGRSFDQQRAFLGEVMAPFSAVAAKHPCAWFPTEHTPAELATPSADNRRTAEPYTKLMNAIMSVDQGAAVVMTSLATARDAGVGDRAVFVWSGADANDVWFPVQRPDLHRSPGIEAAGGEALAAAGLGVDDLDHLDLYSCFPSAVQVGAQALGLALDDARGLTVTGGLPYFGGPGNNYAMHAIATVVDRLRERGGRGLTTGLGWYITKHSVGVYGSEPPPEGFRLGDTRAAQEAIDRTALEVAGTADGRAVVDASTVIYDRDGSVSGAPVFARLDDGRRVAATADPADLGAHLTGVSLVGATVTVSGEPPTYRVVEGAPG